MPRLPTMSRLGNNSAHLTLLDHRATLKSVTMTCGGPPSVAPSLRLAFC